MGTWAPGHPTDIHEWVKTIADIMSDIHDGKATPLDLDELDARARSDGASAAAPTTLPIRGDNA